MKRRFMALGLALALTGSLAACSVEQTQEGELPEVDVQVKDGQLPEFDVDAPHVDVGTKEVTVEVPDIDVAMPGDPDYKDTDGTGSDDGVADDDDDGNG